MVDFLAGLMCLIMGLGIPSFVFWLCLVLKRKRDRDAAKQWDAMTAVAARTPGSAIAHVQTVYQRARRGTKAVIVWQETGYAQDSWFKGAFPAAGSTVLLHGSTGWGPHNHNPRVFYINPGDLLFLLRPGTSAAKRRHLRRVARKGGRPHRG